MPNCWQIDYPILLPIRDCTWKCGRLRQPSQPTQDTCARLSHYIYKSYEKWMTLHICYRSICPAPRTVKALWLTLSGWHTRLQIYYINNICVYTKKQFVVREIFTKTVAWLEGILMVSTDIKADTHLIKQSQHYRWRAMLHNPGICSSHNVLS